MNCSQFIHPLNLDTSMIEHKFKVALSKAIGLPTPEQKDVVVFERGSLTVEIYKPLDRDLQQPHARDEAYFVISGSGTYFIDGDRTKFVAGDFLYAPAGVEHRFEKFSEDFQTWVAFYGPEGGEEVA